MKKSFVLLGSLVFFLLLAACGQNEGTSYSPNIDPTIAQYYTAAAQTSIAFQTGTAVAHSATPNMLPTSTFTPTKVGGLPSGFLATIEPSQVPEMVQSSLVVEPMKPFNGHNIWKITGWNYGFTGFEWMDDHHLLLQIITGRSFSEGWGYWSSTVHAVIGLTNGYIWFPHEVETSKGAGMFQIHSSRWSPQLGRLLTSSPNDETILYSPDGEIVDLISGKLLGISPSGTKILVADDTWIDLTNGKIVDFAWYQKNPHDFPMIPVWSSDEMQVYTCCYLYGNAKTGESFGIPYDNITLDGKEMDGTIGSHYLYHHYGIWVFNDKYLLPMWDAVKDGIPDYLPLFDPSAKTYRNLNNLAGIPSEYMGYRNCTYMYPMGDKYVWAVCFDADYLVDLSTFKSIAFPAFTINSMEYSPSGKFIQMNVNLDQNGTVENGLQKIFSLENKTMKPMPEEQHCHWPHPTDDILLCISDDGKTISLMNPDELTIQLATLLDFEVVDVFSKPDGEKLVLLGNDNSFWMIDYPTLKNLEQISFPRPEWTKSDGWGWESLINNISWSPDGRFLAFIGDKDIYIVDTEKTP